MNLSLTAPRFGGTIRAVASKSCAHRLLICAALSDAPCEIACPDFSDDIFATAACLRALGAEIAPVSGGFSVKPLNRTHLPVLPELCCGESGSTLRFLLPVVAALGCGGVFRLEGRLPERPLSPLYELLQQRGVVLTPMGQPTLTMFGTLRGSDFSISGGVSSQFVSGLLFALPLLGGGTLEITDALESAPYVDLTCRALETSGVQVARSGGGFEVAGSYHLPPLCSVEGDWSNAAVFLAAGAISAEPVTVTGLDEGSCQGDRAILPILERFGAQVERRAGCVTVSAAPLHGIDLDARQIPDLVPVLAAVAACAEGETRITGAQRLRSKESDRLEAVSALLTALGGSVRQTEDGLLLRGSPLHGGEVSAQNDHRIAMAAALCALRAASPVVLHGSEAVRKSYPGFWKDYVNLGGRLEVL